MAKKGTSKFKLESYQDSEAELDSKYEEMISDSNEPIDEVMNPLTRKLYATIVYLIKFLARYKSRVKVTY